MLLLMGGGEGAQRWAWRMRWVHDGGCRHNPGADTWVVCLAVYGTGAHTYNHGTSGRVRSLGGLGAKAGRGVRVHAHAQMRARSSSVQGGGRAAADVCRRVHCTGTSRGPVPLLCAAACRTCTTTHQTNTPPTPHHTAPHPTRPQYTAPHHPTPHCTAPHHTNTAPHERRAMSLP